MEFPQLHIDRSKLRFGLAKSIAELKKPHTITGEKLQTNFMVLDSNTVNGLKKTINGDFKRRVFIEEEASQKEKSFLKRKSKLHG